MTDLKTHFVNSTEIAATPPPPPPATLPVTVAARSVSAANDNDAAEELLPSDAPAAAAATLTAIASPHSATPPPKSSSSTAAENGVDAYEAEEIEATSPSSASPPFVVKTSRANSKLILQNMEEVLNSVKKKHRQKHRRKKEQKKLAMEAAAAAAARDGKEAPPEDDFQQRKREKSEKKHQHHHHHHKKPLQEKPTLENNGWDHSTSSLKAFAKSPAKHHKQQRKSSSSSSPLKSAPVAPENASILKHFPRTPKKGEAADVVVVEVEPSPPVSAAAKPISKSSGATTTTTITTTNAFEVMMNARNKSIGSNTPGKEAPPPSPSDVVAPPEAHVKRKLLLQDWADKKGGAKRKIEEESRAAYVEKQLENRAKRFKKMLVKEVNPKTSSTPTSDKLDNENSSKAKKSKKHPTSAHDGESAEKSTTKRARGRPRTRRLSSTDDLAKAMENTDDISAANAETAEFLAKLNSPTKKRDSLLGYFHKESPKDASVSAAKVSKLAAVKSKEIPQDDVVEEAAAATKTTETPKRRPRRAKITNTATANATAEVIELDSIPLKGEVEETTTKATVAADTPSGRPKRSCAGKSRYDYDLDQSPSKIVRNSKSTSLPKAVVLQPPLAVPHDDNEVEVIDLDHSNPTTPQQTPKKLAPLFMRSMPKPGRDPALLKARQDFLRSGVPEKLLLEKAKQKQYEQSYEESLELFPKVAHVRQWSADEVVELQAESSKNVAKFKFRQIVDASDEKEKRKSKSRGRLASSHGFITGCTGKDFRVTDNKKATAPPGTVTTTAPVALPPIDDKRSIIKEWKANFDRFPTYKCYNQMREKYRYFSAVDSAQDTEQVTESFVVTRRTRRSVEAQQRKFDPNAEEERPPPSAPNGELLFTEKYKPLLFEQVLVNLTPVTQLREFLASWSNGSGGGGGARNSQQALDDSMDFANDSHSSQQAACNSVVLLGPGSSGKTNAVFALANEMNFNVLEINAGMKRTGKKLIQELQEATQSHQIRKESPASVQGAGKAQKNLLKMSLNGLKTKKQSQSQSQINDPDSSSSTDLSQSTSRKCLILIEDADIVFEQTDAGFTDAIYTLAASSKRPVIVVATNPNCQHLQRLMNQNTIRFTAPNVLNISKFLCVLSLIENCPVNLDDLISLYLYNEKNVRRTLLELQFFIQSGGDRQRLTALESKNKQNTEKPREVVQGQFFASPTKRRFSEEPSVAAAVEDKLSLATTKSAAGDKDSVYMHRTLFEFYTSGQNERVRIPFPTDFRVLRINLNDVFQVAQKLKVVDTTLSSLSSTTASAVDCATAKRRTRSPKKAWLSSATKGAAATKRSLSSPRQSPLSNLCDFYENASVAALLGAHDDDFADRLVPHLAEHIAHNLVENAIAVNLAADACPYNLFDTPVERHSLCDYLVSTSSMAMRSKNARSLDYEPNLRAICRSEKLRSTLERRSTRFYHYLRNAAVENIANFSTEHFESTCGILQDDANSKALLAVAAATEEATNQT